MAFDPYDVLVKQLDKKLSILEMNMTTGVNAINTFTDYLQAIENPTSESVLNASLDLMKASDIGMGDDLVDSVNYYKGESRDLVINNLKKFVDTGDNKGIYYRVLESLDSSLNEYQTSVQLQNLKTVTNNLGDIADGNLSFKSQINAAERIMGFMADTPGITNVEKLNNAQNRLKGIIHNMKMVTSSDYNVDVDYLIDKYGPDTQTINNMKSINSKLDSIASNAMDNYNSVLSSAESIVPRKYW